MLPWWWSPQRMMSNSVPEREKETLTGCVSFYTQWIDIHVCIRVRGLQLVFVFLSFLLACLLSFFPSFCLSFFLSVFLSFFLSLSLSLSLYLSIYLSIPLSRCL